MAKFVLKHVSKQVLGHVPDKHVPRHMPDKHLIKLMVHAVMMT